MIKATLIDAASGEVIASATAPQKKMFIKIGAKAVSHVRYVTFQMAEVLVSRSLFYEILERIKHLKPVPIGYD